MFCLICNRRLYNSDEDHIEAMKQSIKEILSEFMPTVSEELLDSVAQRAAEGSFETLKM